MGYSANHDVVLISQILMVGNVSSSNVILNHILKFLSSVVFASSHQLVTDGVRERGGHAGKSIHVGRRFSKLKGPKTARISLVDIWRSKLFGIISTVICRPGPLCGRQSTHHGGA